MGFRETHVCYEDAWCVESPQNKEEGWAVVNTAVELWVVCEEWIY